MVALLVIFMIVAFITADVLVRVISQRMREKKAREERAAALDIALKLDYSDEAPSLKRVTVDQPKAKILAVDDEEIVLGSFRKILVLAGYSVDTVETGREALGLVQRENYDFVFTDLKMPEMDGLEVTKGVKHFRPDVDVIMITGYATVESAVEAMKYGALDYVQKPFTEDELVDFVNKSLIRRQAKLEREKRPQVHLVTSSSGVSTSGKVINVPAGLFVSEEHLWVGIEMDGTVRVGIDDFAQKIVGTFDNITLPVRGREVRRGEPLFSVKQNGRELDFPSPVSGKITRINETLGEEIELLKVKPYETGWLCCVEPSNLPRELQYLRIGADAVVWYKDEVKRFQTAVQDLSDSRPNVTRHENGTGRLQNEEQNDTWEAFSKTFLHVE